MKNFFFSLISLLCLQTLFSQADFTQQGSENSYIFKITEKQALNLFKTEKINEDYFETLIDSFPTSETYTKELPVGHYIKTNAQKNLEQTYYRSVKDFEVFVLNNSKDLIIQIHAPNRNIIENAIVTIDDRNISFDKNQNAFIDKKSNQKGILKVTHAGFTAFYHLDRTQNSSFISRSSKKLAYSYPTKYVWLPIVYLTKLPIDAVKSLQNSYSTGTIWKTKRFFVNLYENVACWFDDYYCDDNEVNYDVAYFVFNKPKFRPNDTLKGKAFIWNKKGKPIEKPVSARIRKSYKEYVKIEEINSQRDGSFDFELHLHDSLNLNLDRSYTIELIDESENRITTERFTFEEYDLKGIDLKLKVQQEKQYKGQNLEVLVNAEDENKLQILDGNIEIELITIKSTFYNEDVFVPDTLWTHQLKLSTTKDTKFSIPDSIFPKANIDYKILAKLKTSDQEYVETAQQISYFHKSKEIKHQVVKDSILVEFLQNGKKVAAKVQIESLDHFGNKNKLYSETTPFQFKIDPLHKAYRFSVSDLEEEVGLNSIKSGINAQLYRTKDSVFMKVSNPNLLMFNYHIFRKDRVIKSGADNQLSFSRKENKLINYYLTLNYVWGGKVIERNYAVPIYDKKLSLKVEQPKLIYPGQKVDVEVQVVDHKQKPVENVDLLAYGMTSKFNFTPSNIQSYSVTPKSRKFRNSFQLNANEENNFEEKLNIDKWDELAKLKKIDYYQLIFPENKIFKHEIALENQPTQFAPFVVNDGEILPIHIIYVNNKPIYFSDMTNVQPYSFAVDNEPVNIQLRTENYAIRIDSIQFKPQHKSIFSLDVNNSIPSVHIEKAPNSLSEYEQNRLRSYVMPYRLINKNFAYLQNQQNYFLLRARPGDYSSTKFLGPIHNKHVRFVQDYQYELDFKLESNYSYTFQPKHLKQSSFPTYNYPSFFVNKEIPSFYDLALTEERIKMLSELNVLQTKLNTSLFDYPTSTTRDRGTLKIESKKNALNLVLANINDDDFFRVYEGSVEKIHDLKPGQYRLIQVYPNQDYSIVDSIDVKPNGINFYNIKDTKILRADSFSNEISELITDFFMKYNVNTSEFYQRKLKQTYQENVQYIGEGHLFSGTVFDESGIPLPGVNVMVKGTNYGTQTDFDGNFQLRVPKQFKDVGISYVGFESLNFEITKDQFTQITLKTSAEHLDEIVVVGYGSSTRRSFTGSVEIVESETTNNSNPVLVLDSLAGQVAGVSILTSQGNYDKNIPFASIRNGQPGQTTQVRIRGFGSGTTSQPLYVINGVPYNGDSISLSADLIQDVTILKSSSATAIYGARGANGVILITTTEAGLQIEENTAQVPDFAIESSSANSVRTNFSDEAFWKPNLTTNKEGKVNFSITYPDDITSWDTHFYAVSNTRQTGQTLQNVKSYRPLIAQLSIPKFLIESDSLLGLGKVKNYIKDSLTVNTSFKINKESKFNKEKQVFDFDADQLKIVAQNTDSLQVSYQVTRKDNGYLDGEELIIPVFSKGIEKAEGKFIKLQPKDTIMLGFNSNLGDAVLSIDASVYKILQDELEIVINYIHSCNEQMASRLKAQLTKRKIYLKQDREFKDEKEIKKLIRLLNRNQKNNSLWGWWSNSSTNLWASLNVVEALLMAEKQDFNVKWDIDRIRQSLIDRFFKEDQISNRIQILQLLDLLQVDINFQEEIERLKLNKDLSVVEQLQLTEMYQKYDGKVSKDKLMKFLKETSLGNQFVEVEEENRFHPFKNNIQASLIAYRIFQNIKPESEVAEKIRDYIIMQRRFGGYANTFQSMQVIETLLNGVPDPKTNEANILMHVNNEAWKLRKENSIVETFKASDQVQITNKSEFPIYINYTQKYIDSAPKKKNDLFDVESNYVNENEEVLPKHKIRAGQPVSLKISINAKKYANYVMIEVPIPSTFSYHNKQQFKNEAHREYAKAKTYIFLEQLEAGKHDYYIQLMPRYEGSFQQNPVKAQLMYFEQLFGNNPIEKVQVMQ